MVVGFGKSISLTPPVPLDSGLRRRLIASKETPGGDPYSLEPGIVHRRRVEACDQWGYF